MYFQKQQNSTWISHLCEIINDAARIITKCSLSFIASLVCSFADFPLFITGKKFSVVTLLSKRFASKRPNVLTSQTFESHINLEFIHIFCYKFYITPKELDKVHILWFDFHYLETQPLLYSAFLIQKAHLIQEFGSLSWAKHKLKLYT